MVALRILMAILSAGPAIQTVVTGSCPPLGCQEAEGHLYVGKWFEDDHHQYDGDSFWINTIPDGWSYRIRLAGVDTPELNAKDEDEKAAADEAKVFTGDWLDERNGWVLLYVEEPWGKYGRLICWVYDFDANNLNNELVEAGLIKHED
jgi:endonuclease YncB( thermonuclease family)